MNDYWSAITSNCQALIDRCFFFFFFVDDGTRVSLEYISGVDGSDYIHANFIDVIQFVNSQTACYWYLQPLLTGILEEECLCCYPSTSVQHNL